MNNNIDVNAIHAIIRRVAGHTVVEGNSNLDRAINVFRQYPSVATLAMLRENTEDRYGADTANYMLNRLMEYKIVPRIKHDLSTKEGYLAAMEEYLVKEMTISGASFGGGFSGAGDNATINATGRAGTDSIMNLKQKMQRRKIDKIIGI